MGVDRYLADGRLQRLVYERLVRGQDREQLLTELETRLPAATALSVVSQAEAEIADLKASGKFDDAEYEVFANPAKKPMDWLGLGILGLGLGSTVASYLAALPGAAYTIWVGAIAYGGYRVVKRLN